MASAVKQVLEPITYTLKECALKVYGEQTVKVSKNPILQHIINYKSADKLASIICPTNKTVFELNPGPGVLTSALLNRGEENIYALEWNEHCIRLLKDLDDKVAPYLKIIPAHKRKASLGKSTIDGMYINLESQLEPSELDSLKCNTNEGSVGVIVSAMKDDQLGQMLFTRYFSSVIDQTAFQQLGPVEYLSLNNTFLLRKLNAKPGSMKYGRLAVLTNMLCHHKLHQLNIPSDHLYPIMDNPKTNKRHIQMLQAMYLIPKQPIDLPNNFELINNFLRYLFQFRATPLMTLLDRKYPGSSEILPQNQQLMSPINATPQEFQTIINNLYVWLKSNKRLLTVK